MRQECRGLRPFHLVEPFIRRAEGRARAASRARADHDPRPRARRGEGPEALRQLAEFARREWRARPARVLVTGDGQATCRLWAEPGIAQIEAVYTSPAARGRGYARRLLAAAIDIALA